MNKEDIIRMAREAKITEGLVDTIKGEVLVWDAETKHLERFAALVAAAEREVCARKCEKLAALIELNCSSHALQIEAINYCAEIIRARGQA